MADLAGHIARLAGKAHGDAIIGPPLEQLRADLRRLRRMTLDTPRHLKRRLRASNNWIGSMKRPAAI